MEFKQSVITNRGRELMAKLLTGKKTKFTKIRVSSTVYTEAQVASLTSLSNIKQETSAQAYGNNNATVFVVGAIENTNLAVGYDINTVGLYAEDPDLGEILYSVSCAKIKGYMPPDTGVSGSGIELKIYTEVSNAANVDLTVDPASYATRGDLQRLTINGGLFEAWSWSEDGTDRFTTTYPNENLIVSSKRMTPEYWTNIISSYNSDGSITMSKSEVTPSRIFANHTRVYPKEGKRYSIQAEIFIENGTSGINGSSLFCRVFKSDWSLSGDFLVVGFDDSTPKGKWIRVKASGKSAPDGTDFTKHIQISIGLSASFVGKVHIRNPKFEEVVDSETTMYTPSPLEDLLGAFPTYKGVGMLNSQSPSDYRWSRSDWYFDYISKPKKTWSWSNDGTERFTTIYPNENLLINSLNQEVNIAKASHGASLWFSADYPTDGLITYAKNIYKLTKSTDFAFGYLAHHSNLTHEPLEVGETYVFSAKVFIPENVPNTSGCVVIGKYDVEGTSWGAQSLSNVAGRGIWKIATHTFVMTTKTANLVVGFGNSAPADSALSMYMAEYKLEKASEFSGLTTNSKEDYLNAIPHYVGTGAVVSGNPSDYSWTYSQEYIDYLISQTPTTEQLNNLADRVSALEP